jgi:hypothetical protein
MIRQGFGIWNFISSGMVEKSIDTEPLQISEKLKKVYN